VILSSYLLDDENNDRIRRAAEAAGHAFIPAPATREERIAQQEARIAEADILLAGRVTSEQLARAPRLRWIHVPWAGVNSLMALDALRRSDIVITNSSGVMSDAVADHVMTCILALSRDLPAQIRAQARGEWIDYEVESPRRRILRGRTVGILGYGAIGRAVAVRARGFGMRAIAMRRDTSTVPPELDRLYGPDEMGDLLAAADMVVVALPLNDSTQGSIGRAQFERMRPDACFINIARGAIVREGELIEALNEGIVAKAALDVFEKEPLPADSPLWHMENVLVTPHVAGGHVGFWDATVDLFLDNLDRYIHGRELRNLVEKERGY
jgi:phosphoglycerate dehydrogenase-like enzyme